MGRPVNPALNSFTAGETSPLLAGRTDLDWYKNSCKQLRDMVSLTEGAATRRPATKFVAEVAVSGHLTILQEFIFAQGQARMIEFGHKTIRFYADKAPIIGGDGLPYQIASSYVATELRALKFFQSADVLFIFHPNHPPAELGRYSDTGWRLVDMPFTDGPYLEVNADNGLTLTPSATTGGITIDASANTATLSIPFWQVTGFPPVIIPLTVTGLTFSGDTVTLPGGTPPIATGQSVFLSGNLPDPLNAFFGIFFWISTGALTGKLAASATDAAGGIAIALGATQQVNFFFPSDVGRFIRIGYIATNWAKATAYAVGDVVKNASNGVYRCSAAGTSQNVDNAGPSGTGIGIGDGTCTWDFVNAGGVEYGYVQITAFITATRVNANVCLSLPGTAATYYWRMGLFSQTTGYPACGGLHQQRMLVAGTRAYPDRIDTSKVADYGNFTPGDADDDPIAETLGLATVDPIRWIASKRVAYIGTSGSVEKIYGTTGYDSPLTSTSFAAVEQVQRGTQDLAPVRVVNGLIYADALSRKIYELYYDFTQDLDLATEITARARHLINSGVVDMAYQREPYSILWVVNGVGQLVGCTYYREQQVLGWHLHTLGGGGFVESIACIPGPHSDQLWMVVRRNIDGETRRYVEVMDEFSTTDTAFTQNALFFADSYSVYYGPPVTEITGLDYLEGKRVQVLADGAPIDGPPSASIVQDGKITLPQAAYLVFVGLGYDKTTTLQPVPLAVPQPGGSPMGDHQRVSKVKLGLFRSGPFLLGPDEDHLDIQPLRTSDDAMDTAVPLKTGPIVCPFDGQFELEADIIIRPIGPLPLTVLWVVPHLLVNED